MSSTARLVRTLPLCALLLAAVAWPALAEAPAAIGPAEERYEERLIAWALQEAGLQREEHPEDKLLERVEIVREDVIALADPYPQGFNRVHWKSRDEVIRQELLVEPGERWDAERVEETARNLRSLLTLSVVRVVPCKGSLPDRVVLLVVTKDLWSLRTNTSFSAVGSVLQVLDLQPSELNFLGWGKTVGLHLRAQQLQLSPLLLGDKAALGVVYSDPRLFGSRWALSHTFDLLVAGATPCGGLTTQGDSYCPPHRAGSLEGFAATVDLQRPLFSLATEWAFDLTGSANVRPHYAFVYNAGTPPPGQTAHLSLDTVTFDPAGTPAAQRVYLPRIYDVVELSSQASLTRSLGAGFKHDLTFALGAYRTRYTPPAAFPFDPQLVAQYVAASLPVSEDVAFAQASLRDHDSRYVTLTNIQSFALTEDFLLGHDATLSASADQNLAAARESFLSFALRSQYRWYRAGDLLTAWLNAQTRWQPHRTPPGGPSPWADNTLDLGAKNVSPIFWAGRLHLQVHLTLRSNHNDQAYSVLGGDTGLRGYAAGAFLGSDLAQVNAEYRSEPVNLEWVHLGFVAFYDGGSVFAGPDPRDPTRTLPFAWHQSLGLGLRAVFPQFDKLPLRIDVGVPLEAGYSPSTWVSLAYQQAF